MAGDPAGFLGASGALQKNSLTERRAAIHRRCAAKRTRGQPRAGEEQPGGERRIAATAVAHHADVVGSLSNTGK
jgi:hypothetical protein